MNSDALLLATYLLRRRAELNLTVDEAAVRAGITSDEWFSLERGRVPDQDDNATFNAVADALETSTTKIAFLACVAEHNQQNRGAHE